MSIIPDTRMVFWLSLHFPIKVCIRSKVLHAVFVVQTQTFIKSSEIL